MPKIAVLASFNMDLVMRAERRPGPGETLQGDFSTYLGGKGFNQAVAARRLGAEVAAIGRVGRDGFGERFLEALDREGIDRTGVMIDDEDGTGVAAITVEPDGANSILQAPQANRRLSADDVRRGAAAVQGAAVGLAQLETSMAAAVAFARAVRRSGGLMLLNPAPAAAVDDELLALADVLVPNAIEARTLCGIDPCDVEHAYDSAEALLKRGPRTVVLTLGEAGAIAVTEGVRRHAPAYAVRAIDTVGAGDAFCAALAVRLAEGASLADALAFANAAGAVSVTRRGAEPSMPRRVDVEALVARG